MKTSPCNADPLTPHFYRIKLEFTGVYIFFLFFALKQRLWVLVSHEAVLTCIHNQCFEQNKENITLFHMQIIVFTVVKICSILHGHVFVIVFEVVVLP